MSSDQHDISFWVSKSTLDSKSFFVASIPERIDPTSKWVTINATTEGTAIHCKRDPQELLPSGKTPMINSPTNDQAWPDSWAATPFAYLTTTGRRTGQPHRIEIWFAAEQGSIYLLSGG